MKEMKKCNDEGKPGLASCFIAGSENWVQIVGSGETVNNDCLIKDCQQKIKEYEAKKKEQGFLNGFDSIQFGFVKEILDKCESFKSRN